MVAERDDEDKKKKSIALKALKFEVMKKVSMKIKIRQWFLKNSENSENSLGNQMSEENLETSRIKRRRRKQLCYEYKKPGHIRSECPLLNN